MAINVKKIFGICVLVLGASIFFVPATTESAVVRRPPNNLNLKAYWSFNEGAGTIATDFSRNYATGTLTNFASPATATSGWGAGKFGKGLNFDGTDDHIQTAYKPTGYSAITISAWVNLSSAGSYPMIVSHGANGDSALEIRGYSTTGQIECVNRSNNTGVRDTVSAVGTGWHHYTCVGIGTNFTLYKDGVSLGSAGISHGLTSTVNLRIGRRSDDVGGSFYFPGKIDEVRVYSAALTPAQVMILYRSGVATFSAVQKNTVTNGLIGHWSFDGRDVVNGAFLDRGGGTHPAYMSPSMATSSAYVPARIGQGIKFDGVDDYMQVPNSADFDFGSGDFTIAWWEYRTGNDNGSPSINRRTAVGDYTPFLLGYSWGGGNLQIYMSSSLGGWDIAAAQELGPVALNQWVHYIVRRSGTTFTAYANGVETSTWESALALADAGGTDPEYDLAFGSYQNIYFFKGVLDDIRIYNRAVSVSEISQIYNIGLRAVSKMNRSKNSLMVNGLVGLWSFDGPDVSAGATAYDRSGNALDGTLNGMSTASSALGKVGQAFNFDGTDDYVSLASGLPSISGNAVFTMCAWINTTSVSTTQTIFATGDTGVALGAAGILLNNGANGAFSMEFAGSNNARTAGGVITANTWYHICGVKTAGAINTTTTLYVNGQSVALAGGASTNTPDVSTTAATIGSFTSNGSYFTGKIDQVRVYDRALSATEVLTLYNAEK